MIKKQQKEMAERIKKRRAALNFTQEQFAEIINISVSSYTKIENAFQQPSLDTLINISKNLNLSLDFIIFGENDSRNEEAYIEMLKAAVNFTDKDKILHIIDFLNKIAKIKDY